ncbi:15538_t:CDS:2, partial [Acaulospora morrowiae]
MKIEEWSNWETLGIDFPIHFTLYVAEVEDSVNNFGNLSARLEKSIMSKYDSINSINGENNSLKSIRFPIKCEMVKWDGWRDVLKERFDPEILNFESRNGQYAFYILPGSSVNTRVLVGNQRQAIIEFKNWNIDFVEKTISNIILSLFLPEQAAIKKFILEPSADAKVEIDSMRTMKYSPMYQVTFSLMNGDPSSLLVDWDIERAVDKYLKPFVDEISIISNMTVESQVQHYARFTFEPRKNINNENESFYLTPELLPHFINAAEWNLASAVTSYPTLNFILYVPSLEQSPLYIQDSKGNVVNNNAFLIPRWGGVVVENPNRSTGSHTFTFGELKSAMSIFIMQLRGLLG